MKTRLAPEPSPDPIQPVVTPPAWRRIELESELLGALVAAAAPSESAELAFRRKEHELCVLFDRLEVADAHELHRRLTLARPGDELAVRFGRLIGARRARLLTFLADARRRDALRRLG